MIRWSPNTELASLHTAMDRLFEGFFGPVSGGDAQRPLRPVHVLPIDVRESETAYEITAAVPGFSPEEVEVTFSDGILRIEAQHAPDEAPEASGYLRREVAWGWFQRAVQLPSDVSGQDIGAAFDNGMLTITVPKVPRPEPRKIQVTSPQKQLGESSS